MESNMSAITPIFISSDRQQWIIALASEASVCYVCSSTKLRNAINQEFKENGVTGSEALHYKEVAGTMLSAIKQVTGNNLEAISFSDGNGKFLKISKTSCEHNFEPTPVEEPKPKDKPVSAKPLDKSRLKRQAEIRARLEKLAL
jgi:hypothetical protein